MNLDISPLTLDLWPAFEDLFGVNGACGGCWCMYWRIGAAYRRQPREKNRAAFRKIVKRGPPPGLLAFDGDVAVGWCQLTPRSALPWLDHQWRLKRVDDVPVWSLSCIYVRIGYRKRGVTSVLDRRCAPSRKTRKGSATRGLIRWTQPRRRVPRAHRLMRRPSPAPRIQYSCLPLPAAPYHASRSHANRATQLETALTGTRSSASLIGQHQNKPVVFVCIEPPFTNCLRRSQYHQLLTQGRDVIEHVRAPDEALVLSQKCF